MSQEQPEAGGEELTFEEMVLAINASGFIEGFKRDDTDLEEFVEFMQHCATNIDDAPTLDRINSIIDFCHATERDVPSETEVDWHEQAEKFYENSEVYDIAD